MGQNAAVVEIGSTGIRLLVAELYDDGSWRILDHAEKSVELGRDVFTSHKISRESFLHSLSALRGFCEMLTAWGIKSGNAKCIATSALRAAGNRDVFVDRVLQETGFSVNIVEGIEENRLMYLAVRYALKDDLPPFFSTSAMIIDVGGGSTEIMLLRRGKMVAAHSLKFGTISIDEQSRLAARSATAGSHYIVENLRDTQNLLNIEMDLSHIETFIASGPELCLVSQKIGAALNENSRSIEREAFFKFVQSAQNYRSEDCIENLAVPPPEAAGFIPALLIYNFFFKRTNAEHIVVPLVSLREGLLIDLGRKTETSSEEEFFNQIVAGAINLGRKYFFDEAHSRHVTHLALILFDSLANEHGMNRRDRLMLEIAGILHDIGMFIGESGHQKHGCYIIANSEIFGLLSHELKLLAQIVRCHRGLTPTQDDVEIADLGRKDRMLILKTAALLRAADGLDRSHYQRIKNFTIEKKTGLIIIHPEISEQEIKPDLSLERLGLELKSDLFQDVFGYKIILQQI
jgi:exopolyphosphatase/guanosine-5'-triphosphate,3'-diphosphate pyrophosphatase